MRTRASKQAMNHLLHQLEAGGYIVREAHPDDRRTRVVRLTERGWAAQAVIQQTMARLEMHWYRALGEDVYAGLSHALERLQEVLERQPTHQRLRPGRTASRRLERRAGRTAPGALAGPVRYPCGHA